MSKYTFFFLLIFFTAATTIYGQTASIAGSISTLIGEGIPNATVNLKADNFQQTAITDNSGTFLFTEIPTGTTYTIEMEQTGDILNGLSTFDLVLMQQAILTLRMLESSGQSLAADIDLSGTVSVRDMWILRQLILGISNTIDTPSWRLVSEAYQYPDPFVPFTIMLTEDIGNLNLIGAKAGDVNGSARF